MRASNDPLRVGRGEIWTEPEDARAELCRICELVEGVLRAQLGGTSAFVELLFPRGLSGEKAPVVSNADGVEQINMWRGKCMEINVPAAIVGACDDGGDAHVEIRVGFTLASHAGEAINKAGNDIFSGAVDDMRAFGDGNCAARAYIGDLAIADDDDGIMHIVCRAAPVGEIDYGAARQNERD